MDSNTVSDIVDSVTEVAATTIGLGGIVPEHDGEGANYFFKIVDEALETIIVANRPKKRRRKLDRAPVEECTQISLL